MGFRRDQAAGVAGFAGKLDSNVRGRPHREGKDDGSDIWYFRLKMKGGKVVMEIEGDEVPIGSMRGEASDKERENEAGTS